MTKRVVLHIGAMKTGTTYLQAILKGNPGALAAHGIVEGRTLGRPAIAVAGVLARPSSSEAARPWRELAARALASPHDTVVISTEYLSFARPHQLKPLLEPFSGAHVEAVLTIRDQTSAIASQWQTYCRNFGIDTWPDYLRSIDPARGGTRAAKAWKTYYRAQQLDRIVRDWTAHDTVALVHVLTPPSRRDGDSALWQAFTAAADLGDVPVTLPQTAINPSVGHASAQMLQDLGRHWKARGARLAWVRDTMRPYIRAALVPRTQIETTPVLDGAGWAFAQERNRIAVEAIERAEAAGRLSVHGTLDSLAPRPAPGHLSERAAGVSRSQVRAAAQALWSEARSQSSADAARRPLTYSRMLASITTMIAASADAEDVAV